MVNELIQRYRLISYDYFAHEVSAWDVPIWYIKHEGAGYRASLLRYKEWDRKPVMIDRPGLAGSHEKGGVEGEIGRFRPTLNGARPRGLVR